MRWIKDDREFKELYLEAKTCVFIDSAREETPLKKLVFDDATLCTPQFAAMLKTLMGLSGQPLCRYIVLDPHPLHYFHRHFNKYPALEIAESDSPETYLDYLNQDPGGSPVDAVGTMNDSWAIVAPSIKWFAHAIRDSGDSGGHLWIPSEWLAPIRQQYSFLYT